MSDVSSVQDLESVPELAGTRTIQWLAGRAQMLRANLIEMGADHPDWDADAAVRWLTAQRMDPRVVVLTLRYLGKTFPQEWQRALEFAGEHAVALEQLRPERPA